MTKKGNNYHFGMTAHIGVDAASGLVHNVVVTAAKVADGVMTDALLHGEEQVVLGDRAYSRNGRNLEAERRDGERSARFPSSTTRGRP